MADITIGVWERGARRGKKGERVDPIPADGQAGGIHSSRQKGLIVATTLAAVIITGEFFGTPIAILVFLSFC